MFRRPPIVKKSDGLITLQSKLIDKIPTVPHKKSKNEVRFHENPLWDHIFASVFALNHNIESILFLESYCEIYRNFVQKVVSMEWHIYWVNESDAYLKGKSLINWKILKDIILWCNCRVCWGLAIALSFALGGLWIFGNFQDTDDEFSNRIILRQSKTPSSIDEIPFPAVSVCPVSRVDMKKFNYTEVYRSMLKLDGDNSRNVTRNE